MIPQFTTATNNNNYRFFHSISHLKQDQTTEKIEETPTVESPLIVRLTRQNYQQELSNSKQVLVIDFYADWCAPCQSFTPILEKVVKERNGFFKLLKVNSDEEMEIASAFKVSALPTMFIVWQSKAITQKIEGGISEEELNQLFDSVERELSNQQQQQEDSSESQSEESLDQKEQQAKTPEQKLEISKQLISMGHMPKAMSLLSRILTDDVPTMDAATKEKIVPNVYSLFSMCYLMDGDFEQSGEMIEKIKKDYPAAAENTPEVKSSISLHEIYEAAGIEMMHLASTLREHIEVARQEGREFDFNQIPLVADLKARIEKDPKDYEAYFNLSLFLFLGGNTKAAVDQAMALARKNIKWNNMATKRLILNYANITTDKKESDAIRRKLASFLYV